MITCPSTSKLTSLIQFIIVTAVAAAVFAVLLPVFDTARSAAVLHLQTRMADLGRSMQEYADDYDGVLPCGSYSYKLSDRSSLTGVGWAGQLYPYVRTAADFDDPFGSAARDPVLGSVVAYAYNQNAARAGSATPFHDRSKTVLLYQVTGAKAKLDLPNEGSCDSNAPCSPAGDGTIILLSDASFPRHAYPATGNLGDRFMDHITGLWPKPEVDGGSYFLLADGHVRWYEPQSVSAGENASTPTTVQSGTITGNAAGTSNTRYEATFSTM